MKVASEVSICVTVRNTNFSFRQIKILIKLKFHIAKEASQIITEDLPLPTHEYTDEKYSESDDDDDDDVDSVPMPFLQMKEKNFIYQNR